MFLASCERRHAAIGDLSRSVTDSPFAIAACPLLTLRQFWCHCCRRDGIFLDWLYYMAIGAAGCLIFLGVVGIIVIIHDHLAKD